jgi:putative membrane protein
MVTLVRWRVQLARGEAPDTSPAGRFASISHLQAALVLLMVLAATAMARGIGVVPRS